MVRYPSGQRGQTVNLLANAFDGSNPSPTTTDCNPPRLPLPPPRNRSFNHSDRLARGLRTTWSGLVNSKQKRLDRFVTMPLSDRLGRLERNEVVGRLE